MKILNLANLLSLFRILISPIFMILILSGEPNYVILSAFLFLIAAITDYLDGFIARKMNAETKIGRFVDPLADKFLTTAAFLSFVFLEIIPLWMVVIIIIRDFGTTLLRIIGDKKNNSVKTSKFAKYKTFLQMAFIAVVLFLFFLKSLDFYFDKEFLNKIIYSDYTYFVMLFITIITVISLFEYIFVQYFKKTE